MIIRPRPVTIAVVVLHVALLAAYTLPATWVPLRARYWAQAYARLLFHQDWRLFAPDPPACGCSIEYKTTAEGEWEKLEDLHHHFIWRRMSANACRYAEATDLRANDAPDALVRSLARMIEPPAGEECALRITHGRGPCEGEILPVRWRLERFRP